MVELATLTPIAHLYRPGGGATEQEKPPGLIAAWITNMYDRGYRRHKFSKTSNIFLCALMSSLIIY